MNPSYTRAGVVTVAIAAVAFGFFLGTAGTGGAIELRQWQTLMAALVALGAASIAYRGALAKVSLDREVIERDARRRKLAIGLRLDYALQMLGNAAVYKATKISKPNGMSTKTVKFADVCLLPPTELNEAWENLDMFPRRLVVLLAELKTMFRIMDEVQARAPESEWQLNSWGDIPSDALKFRDMLNRIRSYTKEGNEILAKETAI